MKEILSSSGKNVSNILYPKGIKDKTMKKEEPEKENGGSKDMVIGGKIMGKYNNLDYLSMTLLQEEPFRIIQIYKTKFYKDS